MTSYYPPIILSLYLQYDFLIFNVPLLFFVYFQIVLFKIFNLSLFCIDIIWYMRRKNNF